MSLRALFTGVLWGRLDLLTDCQRNEDSNGSYAGQADPGPISDSPSQPACPSPLVLRCPESAAAVTQFRPKQTKAVVTEIRKQRRRGETTTVVVFWEVRVGSFCAVGAKDVLFDGTSPRALGFPPDRISACFPRQCRKDDRFHEKELTGLPYRPRPASPTTPRATSLVTGSGCSSTTTKTS
jgi:hypothetical protein